MARDSSNGVRLIGAAFAVLACGVQLYAFHWGVITPDTVVQYGQAVSGQYDDWHPPITAWLWRQTFHVAQGGAPMLVLNVLLYWGAILLIANMLARRNGWPAAALMLALGLLPIPFGEVGSILKDPLLACLLAMAAALAIARENRGSIAYALAALPLIVVASATRFNAPFAAAPLLLLLLPARWTQGMWRFAGGLIVAAALLAASSWAINVAMLKPHRSQPFLQLVNFDLAGIVAHGGRNGYPLLSDRAAARFTAHCYDPHLYGARDQEACAIPEDSLAVAVEQGESGIGIWLNAIIGSPVAYLKHRVAHLNHNMRFMLPAVPNDAVYVMSAPNDLGLHFTINPLAKAISDAAYKMAVSPLGRPATWMAIALGLLIVARTLPSRHVLTALGVSALAYGGAYMVVSVAADLRYNLWTLLAGLIGIAIVVAEGRSLKLWRVGAGLVPILAVMALEWRALA